MSAREIVFTQIRRMSEAGESHQMGTRWVLEALTAAGWRLVGSDEVDPVTVERCAKVADAQAEHFAAIRQRCDNPHPDASRFLYHCADSAVGAAENTASAIRAIASGGKQ